MRRAASGYIGTQHAGNEIALGKTSEHHIAASASQHDPLQDDSTMQDFISRQPYDGAEDQQVSKKANTAPIVMARDDESDLNGEISQYMELIKRELELAESQELAVTKESHWFIDSCGFQAVVGILILLNTVQMGLEAEFPENETLWLLCENMFTLAFLIEMAVKLFLLGWRVYGNDPANWLDSFIVGVSVLDCWVFAIFSASANLQSLSILRIIRLVRLVRVLRLVKHLQQLVIVVRGVVNAITMTFWIGMVVFLSVYVGAIVCTEYIGRGTETLYPGYTEVPDEIDEQEVIVNFNPYLTFGSMPKAMLTLFNIALMAEWVEVVRPVTVKQPMLMIFFLLFLFFTAFGVMNVMVGMIVDNVMKESARMDQQEFDDEKRRKLCYLAKIRDLIWKIDTDKDGIIGAAELDASLNHDEIGASVHSMLNRMKIPLGLKAEELLYMLDNDGDGAVHYNEFVRSFFRLIESTEFQQICIVQMGVNHVKNLIRSSSSEMQTNLRSLKEDVQMLRDQIMCKIDHGGDTPKSTSLPCSSDAVSARKCEDHNHQSQDSAKTRDDILASLIKDSQLAVERKLVNVDVTLQSVMKEFRQMRTGFPVNIASESTPLENALRSGALPSVRADEDCPDMAAGKDLVRVARDLQARDEVERLRCLGKSRSQPSLHDSIDIAVCNERKQSFGVGQHFTTGCFEAVRIFQSQFGGSGVGIVTNAHREEEDKDKRQENFMNEECQSSTTTLCEVSVEDIARSDGQFGVELKFTHPLVSNVRIDSVARSHGIRCGDVILTCNGISTWGMSRDDVVKALKQRPLKLGIERQSFQSPRLESQFQRQVAS